MKEVKGRAADDIVSELESKILSSTLKEGENLASERDLMSHYSVGRTVVREAIATLASRGLIFMKQGCRPIVRKPGIDLAFESANSIVTHLLNQEGGFKNLFDFRIMIETSLARQAALKADKDDIIALREALLKNERAICSANEFYSTDVAFHAILHGIPKNPILPAVQNAYVSWLSEYWKNLPKTKDFNKKNYLAHKRVFEAILDRNPDKAESAIKDHLESSWNQIEGIINQNRAGL